MKKVYLYFSTILLACIANISFAAPFDPNSVSIRFQEDAGKIISVEVETTRLILRPTKKADENFHDKVFSDPEATCSYGNGLPRPQERIDSAFKLWSERWDVKDGQCNPFGGFIVVLKETNAPIGHIVAGNGCFPGQASFAGIELPEYEGNSYASEATNAIINHYLPALAKRKYEVRGAVLNRIHATTIAPSDKLPANTLKKTAATCHILSQHGFIEVGLGERDFQGGKVKEITWHRFVDTK